MNNYIRITESCSEKLENMTDVEAGKFCELCNKTVIDFSAYTNSEIKDFFHEKRGQNVCGIFFKTEQKKVFTSQLNSKNITSRNTTFVKVAASLALSGSIFNLLPAQSLKISQKEIVKKTELTKEENKETTKENGDFIISGKLLSADKNKPILGEVSFLTTKKIYTAKTDSNGNYKLVIPKDILKYESLLEFSAEDYEYNTKLEIITIENLGKKKTVKLENNGMKKMYGIVEFGPPLAGKNSLVIVEGKILNSNTFNKSYSLYPNQYIVRYIPKEFVKFFTKKENYEDIYLVFFK